jgi:sialidase-1
VLNRSGDLVLLTTRDGRASETGIISDKVPERDIRRVFVQRSKDNGRAWTAATDITTETKQANLALVRRLPGHAIVLRHGPHAGRSWHMGFSDDRSDGAIAADETTVTETQGAGAGRAGRDPRRRPTAFAHYGRYLAGSLEE